MESKSTPRRLESDFLTSMQAFTFSRSSAWKMGRSQSKTRKRIFRRYHVWYLPTFGRNLAHTPVWLHQGTIPILNFIYQILRHMLSACCELVASSPSATLPHGASFWRLNTSQAKKASRRCSSKLKSHTSWTLASNAKIFHGKSSKSTSIKSASTTPPSICLPQNASKNKNKIRVILNVSSQCKLHRTMNITAVLLHIDCVT